MHFRMKGRLAGLLAPRILLMAVAVICALCLVLALLPSVSPPSSHSTVSIPWRYQPVMTLAPSLVQTADPYTGRLEDIPHVPDWYECVRRFLMLDASGMPTLPVLEMKGAIPVLVTPLTGDASFLPRFVCSIDVPVRFYVVIMNEKDKLTKAVVDELQRRFGHSGRLIVKRNRYNRGYSGSMNQGTEWAMTELTNDEAPWFFLCNVDAVFGNHILSQMVDFIADKTTGDAAMLEALREEVEMEQRLVEEGNFSYFDRYVPPGRPLKVLRTGYPGVPLNVRTAPLLPDRIRYMHTHRNRDNGIYTEEERRERYFGGYVGSFTPVIHALGTIALTRLFVSTVGYFDENYFPAYMDDIDLQWRMHALGFRSLYASSVNNAEHPVWFHFVGSNFYGTPEDNTLFKFSNEDNMSRHAFRKYIERRGDEYDITKYGDRDRSAFWHHAPEGSNYTWTFFNLPDYPLDTWVLDDEVRMCMFRKTFDYGTQKWIRSQRCPYNPSVIEKAGILGGEQLTKYLSR